jgi:hypothetical protein
LVIFPVRRNSESPRRHVRAVVEPLVARLENGYSTRSADGVWLSARAPNNGHAVPRVK